MKVVVPKAGTVSDLTVVVAKMTGVEASKVSSSLTVHSCNLKLSR